MTDSQIKTAAERCWIDAETPVRKPQASEWTKLGDAAPARRITEERVANDDTRDIDTSAMILLSGEFELVDDGAAPTTKELAAARPPLVSPGACVLGLALLAGGGFLAHRYVPGVDAELSSLVAAMRPAPMPTPAASAPSAPLAPSTPSAPVAASVTSPATPTLVPKMRAPAPKMREPAPKMREPAPRVAKPKPAPKAKAKARSGRS